MQYILLARKCLRAYGLLCLGVYRLFDDVIDGNEVTGQRTLTEKRYVITHPRADFRLMDTDKVIGLTYLLLRGRVSRGVIMKYFEAKFRNPEFRNLPRKSALKRGTLPLPPPLLYSQHLICSLTIRHVQYCETISRGVSRISTWGAWIFWWPFLVIIV